MISAYMFAIQSALDPPTSDYKQTQILGWKVYIEVKLKTDSPELYSKSVEILTKSLKTITETLPKDKVDILKKTKIWMDSNSRGNSAAVYHPSREWLVSNNYNPDKADSVEISHPNFFIEWANIQPSMVLHELAHAYHDQVLGFNNKEISEAFDRAVESKKYESISHINGNKQKHYALTNPQEFFAEMTEAYFGKNDMFPFTKQELKDYDQKTFQLIEKIWMSP